MVKIHSCSICNYSTTKHCNFKRHMKSTRHMNNVLVLTPQKNEEIPHKNEEIPHKNEELVEIFKCPYCNKDSTKKNKSRHLKICKEKIKKENDNKKKQSICKYNVKRRNS